MLRVGTAQDRPDHKSYHSKPTAVRHGIREDRARPPKEVTDRMKAKGLLPCQRNPCRRDAVTMHVITYRGLRFHQPLCEEHGAELQALEGTGAPETKLRASEEVIRITHGQETIAQLCYTHSCPAITID